MEVAPKTARERRQTAARFARVERWAEDSGNAALMGRELPPDEVLACDQRICWWAGELRKAGLEGGMDELRARAFLDLVLGKDSRPRPGPDGTAAPAAGDSTASTGSASTAAGQEAGDRASSGGSASGGGNGGGSNSGGERPVAAATVAQGRSSLPVRARRAAPGTAGRAGSPGGSR